MNEILLHAKPRSSLIHATACASFAFLLLHLPLCALGEAPVVPRKNCPRLQVHDSACVDALPACKISQAEAPTDCFSPSSCECYAQCEEVFYLDNWHSQLNRHCFYTNGTILQSLDKALTKQWYVYKRKYTVEPGTRDTLCGEDPDAGKPVELPHDLTWLKDCDHSCNHRGWCRQSQDGGAAVAPARCHCFEPWWGENCSKRDDGPGMSSSRVYATDDACWNNCNGRGTCKQGVCLCNDGFYGIDCSLPLANELPGADFYVYELPPGMNSWWAHLDDRDIAVHISEYLLRSPYRTTDPEKAVVFWLPVAPLARLSHGMALLALDWVRRSFPYYNRSGGRDHAIAYGWDSGSCYVSRHPLVMNTIQVSSFGLERADKKQGCDCRLCGPGYTLLVPDIMEMNHKRRTMLRYGEPDNSERMIGVFFAGSPTGDERMALFELTSGAGWAEAVRTQWDPAKGSVDVNNRATANVERTTGSFLFEGMSTAKFCLAPPGSGFGTRGTLAILLGCVPVYIGDIHEPWEDVIDYSAFSLRVRVPDLPQLLQRINGADYAALRAGLNKIWHLFSWASIFGPIGGEPVTHDAMHMMLAGARKQARGGSASGGQHHVPGHGGTAAAGHGGTTGGNGATAALGHGGMAAGGTGHVQGGAAAVGLGLEAASKQSAPVGRDRKLAGNRRRSDGVAGVT